MAYKYSNIEYTEMVRILARCNDNATEARRQYALQYPKLPTPSRATMFGATQRLRDYGQFQPKYCDRGRPPSHTVKEEEDILDFFDVNPAASTNDAARRFNVSQFFAWSVLNNEGKYPFHLQRLQDLPEPDKPARVDFCNWILAERPTILWTGEATFGKVGLFNGRNEHLWSCEKPHAVKSHNIEDSFSVNVWAGIINSTLLGPVFLDRINAETYHHFLINTLPVLLEDVPLSSLPKMYYQHDGRPAHQDLQVRKVLDKEFPGRWIGRHGPRAWPSRSPDITPLHFYLWGHVRTFVYADGSIPTRDELVEKITWAFEQIKNNPQVLSRVIEQLIFRCGLCIGCAGDYFERYVGDTHRHPETST